MIHLLLNQLISGCFYNTSLCHSKIQINSVDKTNWQQLSLVVNIVFGGLSIEFVVVSLQSYSELVTIDM